MKRRIGCCSRTTIVSHGDKDWWLPAAERHARCGRMPQRLSYMFVFVSTVAPSTLFSAAFSSAV